MSRKAKSIRIWTNRSFPDRRSYEALEINPYGIIHWVGIDFSTPLNSEGCEFSFPVGTDFVADKFQSSGITFDVSRLPNNVIENPYERWL